MRMSRLPTSNTTIKHPDKINLQEDAEMQLISKIWGVWGNNGISRWEEDIALHVPWCTDVAPGVGGGGEREAGWMMRLLPSWQRSGS